MLQLWESQVGKCCVVLVSEMVFFQGKEMSRAMNSSSWCTLGYCRERIMMPSETHEPAKERGSPRTLCWAAEEAGTALLPWRLSWN